MAVYIVSSIILPILPVNVIALSFLQSYVNKIYEFEKEQKQAEETKEATVVQTVEA